MGKQRQSGHAIQRDVVPKELLRTEIAVDAQRKRFLFASCARSARNHLLPSGILIPTEPRYTPRMLLHIIARGKIGRSPEAELVDRYAKRIAWGLKVTELPDKGGPIPPSAQTPSRTVAMDERGKQLTSAEFATILGRWRDDGVRETRFLIGAADGHDEASRDGADLLIAFGKATWPHMLARAMLAEQLWRATSILAGHPYHREG